MHTNDCFNRSLLLLLITIITMSAGDPRVKYLGIEQGLSNNAVTCIAQDGKGFMWFGTYDGLNRYDGYGVTVYRNNIGDSSSIPFNNIATIAADSYSNLWVGGQKGIAILNPVSNKFSVPAYVSCDGRGIVSDKENTHVLTNTPAKAILAGSHNNGLIVFPHGTTVGRQIALNGRGSYDVFCIEPDPSSNQVWIFVQGKGLYLYEPKTYALNLVNNTIHQCFSLKIDHKGRIWIGSDNGIQCYDKTNNTFSANLLPQRNRVVSISIEQNDDLYLGTDGAGIWKLQADKELATPLLSETGGPLVSSNAVYSIFTDKDGRKWIGTLRGGIDIIEPRRTAFTAYTVPGDGNPIDNFILSFCEDAAHAVWIGTDGAGLRLWNRKTGTFKAYVHDPKDKGSISNNFITGILRDHEDRIWVSTWFEGINRLNGRTGKFDHYSCFNPETNAEEKHIWTIIEDSENHIWASATNEGCLYRYDDAEDKFVLFDNRIQNLQTLMEDKEGNLWGGNYTSLIKIDRINRHHETFSIGYTIRSLHEDQQGQFWIGTQEGGLLKFDRRTGRYKRYTTAQGLPGNTILRILEDTHGNLWMSTYNGLTEYQRKEDRFRNFSTSDGLQSLQYSFNAALTLSTGEMLFGGIKGYNMLFPDSVHRQHTLPEVYLTGIRIRNEAIAGNSPYVTAVKDGSIGSLKVPFNQAMLSLDFTALEYDCTDKLNYAYYLSGWDKDWNYSNGSRTANYSSLREGDYVFKVRVSRADGTWSKEKTLLHVIILPPWYRTWLAYMAYLLTVVGIIGLYLQYARTKWQMQYEVRLAQMETQKEKELIERKLSFFTHITHEFRNPLTLIINPVKDLLAKRSPEQDMDCLPLVYRNAQRLLSLVDQLLLFRKAESGLDELKLVQVNIVELCHEVFLCFTDSARAKKIDYRFECPVKDMSLVVDKEKMEMVLYNLISNALKYTQEKGAILVRVGEEGGQVLLEVRDTGAGIPEEIGDRLFDKFYQFRTSEMTSISGFGIGLYLVKQFVDAHEGTISYQSEKHKGTTFRVLLPQTATESNPKPEPAQGLSALVREIAEETPGVGSQMLKDQSIGSQARKDLGVEGQLYKEPAIGRQLRKDPGEGHPENDGLITSNPSLLIVDDDPQIINYIGQIFEGRFLLYKALNGDDGIKLARRHHPDLIISDLHMDGISGIEMCETIKNDPVLGQIPVILLTASTSANYKLEGVKHGADDYITKPFDRDLLVARVGALLESRSRVERSIYHAIVHGTDNPRLTPEDKAFLEQIIAVVENHLDEDDFSIPKLSAELNMSHSKIYQKLKELTHQSLNNFIRTIRLKKAAELFINTNYNVNEVALMVGIGDGRYFREQFHKLFGVNPSDYIKKYRKVFSAKYQLNKNVNLPPNS